MVSAPRFGGYAYAAAAAVLYGLVNAVAKDANLHPLVLTAASYLVAGLVLAPMLRGVRVARRDRPTILALALAGGVAAPVALFYGLSLTTAVAASFLLTLELVFTTALAFAFLGERLPGRGWWGLVVLFVAAAVAAAGPAVTGGAVGGSVAGNVLAVAAAFFWGVDNVLSAPLARRYRPHHLVALKGLLGGAVALVLVAVAPVDLAVPRESWPHLTFIGLLGVGGAVLLFYMSLERIGATRTVAVFVPGTAVAGALGGWALLGEHLAWPHGVAVALVVVGVLLVTRAEAGAAAVQPTPR